VKHYDPGNGDCTESIEIPVPARRRVRHYASTCFAAGAAGSGNYTR
jgi:hypothetical protein